MAKMRKVSIFVIFALKFVVGLQPNKPCLKYGKNCICTESYCDTLNIPEPESKSTEFVVISTSALGLPFSYTRGTFEPSHGISDPSVAYLEIDRRRPYTQSKIIGFGSTFTDSDLEILNRLTPNLRDAIFKSYFSSKGMHFDLLQIPISQLYNFKQKLLIKDQFRTALNKENIKVIAAVEPTSLIDFTNQNLANQPQNWTTSQMKLMDSLTQSKIWRISVQPSQSERSFNADQIVLADFLHNHLNETMNSNAKLILVDNTKVIQNPWVEQLQNYYANSIELFDMICLGDHPVSPDPLCRVYKKYQKPILFARGVTTAELNVISESWKAAEELIYTLMSLLQRNVAAFINNRLISYSNSTFDVDSLILTNKFHSKIVKTPSFYALAHFSRYILPDSLRINAIFCGPSASVQTVAYLRPDFKIAIVLYNAADTAVEFVLVDRKKGQARFNLKPKSINTFLYSV